MADLNPQPAMAATTDHEWPTDHGRLTTAALQKNFPNSCPLFRADRDLPRERYSTGPKTAKGPPHARQLQLLAARHSALSPCIQAPNRPFLHHSGDKSNSLSHHNLPPSPANYSPLPRVLRRRGEQFTSRSPRFQRQTPGPANTYGLSPAAALWDFFTTTSHNPVRKDPHVRSQLPDCARRLKTP
jgi:hypothetical protein